MRDSVEGATQCSHGDGSPRGEGVAACTKCNRPCKRNSINGINIAWLTRPFILLAHISLSFQLWTAVVHSFKSKYGETKTRRFMIMMMGYHQPIRYTSCTIQNNNTR